MRVAHTMCFKGKWWGGMNAQKYIRIFSFGLLVSVAVWVSAAPASQWACRFLNGVSGCSRGIDEKLCFFQAQRETIEFLASYLSALFLYFLIWCVFVLFLKNVKNSFPNSANNCQKVLDKEELNLEIRQHKTNCHNYTQCVSLIPPGKKNINDAYYFCKYFQHLKGIIGTNRARNYLDRFQKLKRFINRVKNFFNQFWQETLWNMRRRETNSGEHVRCPDIQRIGYNLKENATTKNENTDYNRNEYREKRAFIFFFHEDRSSIRRDLVYVFLLLLLSEAGIVVFRTFLQIQPGSFSQYTVWVAYEIAYWLFILHFVSWLLCWAGLSVCLVIAEERKQIYETVKKFWYGFTRLDPPRKAIVVVFFVAFLLFFNGAVLPFPIK